jgi:membrane protease YdiL (CAAX protease family)
LEPEHTIQGGVQSPPGKLRILGEVTFVMAMTFVGLVVGSLTGIVALSSVFGMVFALASATWCLSREGITWRDLGFGVSMDLRRFLLYTSLALAGAYLITSFVVAPLLRQVGAEGLDVSALRGILEGNLLNYLVFLIPISWGSAAFGEELLVRGFLQHRFTQLAGEWLGIVLQAAVFALAHAYQGISGVANIFALAMVFGYVYRRCGRNLWPVIAAHGIVDTIGITLIYMGYTDLLVGAK